MSDEALPSLMFDDLEPITLPVSVKGKKYVLCEASADAVVKWRNSQIRNTKMSDGKVTGVGDVADSEPLLVSLCLYDLLPSEPKAPTKFLQVLHDGGTHGWLLLDGNGNPDQSKQVHVSKVRAWPSKVQGALFDSLKRISGLDDRETIPSLNKKIVELTKKRQELLDAQHESSGQPDSNGHASEGNGLLPSPDVCASLTN